jgi:hypothetical protein
LAALPVLTRCRGAGRQELRRRIDASAVDGALLDQPRQPVRLQQRVHHRALRVAHAVDGAGGLHAAQQVGLHQEHRRDEGVAQQETDALGLRRAARA